MSGNVHEGHRARQKEKFRAHGLDSFTDVEALELLLYYAIPRADTNELAHALLKEFRSFRGVMEADLDALQRVPGIGENAATLLRLVTALDRRYRSSADARGVQIRSAEDAGAYLLPRFAYCSEECSMLLCLDPAGRVISCRLLAEGTPSSVSLEAREIAETVLRDKADRVILAHNHVSGVALPSDADVSATKRLCHMLRMIGVTLEDHLVISDGDFVSMRESGHFAQF